jgi:hypothetical protein
MLGGYSAKSLIRGLTSSDGNRAVGWLVVALLICLGIGIWLLYAIRGYLANGASAFSGDGEIKDTGFWTYPRYHILLPRIPANKSGTHTFSFRGVPHSDSTFVLVADAAQAQALADASESITIGVRLLDGLGKTLCQVRRPLTQWKKAEYPEEVAY